MREKFYYQKRKITEFQNHPKSIFSHFFTEIHKCVCDSLMLVFFLWNCLGIGEKQEQFKLFFPSSSSPVDHKS